MIKNKFLHFKKTFSFLLIFSLAFVLKGTINIETKDRGREYDYQRNELQSASDRIFVKYKKQSNSRLQAEVKSSIEAIYGIKAIKYFPFIDVYLYETYWYKESTLGWLNRNPNIEYAEPDYIVFIDSTTPNDPNFGNLWGMATIDAPEAWDLSTGSSSVVVAVIDTGVDYNHEDLSANMWTNSGETPGNSVDDDGNGYVDDYYGINAHANDGDPMDDHGHGTHVSGTVAGVGNNGVGVVGVCWTAKIMALKFLTSGGWGYTSNAVECVEYAVDKDADIMSNSWGGGGYSATLKAAIEAAKDAGILFIAAAGNDGWDNDSIPHYPSSYDSDNIIAVTAIDSSDNQWYNYGLTSVDVAAPGRSIQSTYLNNGYFTWNGTSMATPHVAGLAALIKSYDSGLTWQQIKDRIFNGVEILCSLSGKISTEGRINAYNSLSGSSPVSPVISGTVTTGGGGGLEGVTITFSNGGCTATTDSSGNYSQTVSSGWSGSATPSKSGYTFSPSSRSYTNVTSNQTNQDYTATLLTYVVSGNVSVTSSTGTEIIKAGLNGVVMSGLPGNPTTDSSGNYTATVDYGWSGTATPAKTGYTFSPSSRSYTNVTSNQAGQDYTATATTVNPTISGTVTTSGSGGFEGVSITFSNGGGTATTDSSGNYSQTVSSGWSGSATPSKSGYTFSPSSRSYTNVTSNQAGQDYTATAITPTISGSVTTASSKKIEGMIITFSNGGGTATTDSSGNYSNTVSYGYSGSATPSKDGYTFYPSSRSYSNVTSSQTDQDYTGIPDVTTCINSVPSDHWKGEYYANMNLDGSASMERDDGDSTLSFDWKEGSPGSSCGIGTDGFSVRWTRIVSFSSGTWRFTVTADDGFRLYVDGSLVLDYWIDQPPTTYTTDVSLTSGDHTIIMEYYENGGDAVAKLSWEIVSGDCVEDVPSNHWKGEYYDNMTLSDSPLMTRDDGESTLDFDWGTGSPSTSCGIGSDAFSVRWTRTISFSSGTWRFTVTADDGFHLYVDGSLVLDYWIDQPPTTYTTDVSLTSGDHTIIMEYYENGGGAVAKLSWEKLSGSCYEDVPSDHWKGEYYNNMDLSGSASMTRDDGESSLDFNWGTDSPSTSCGIGADEFSVRWTRTASFSSGTWRFTVTSDDGFRLYVDGSLVLDYWIDQPPTTYTVDVALTSSDHTIKLEYYENSVTAVAKLSWEIVSGSCYEDVSSDHWKGEYYNNMDLSGSASMTRDDGESSLDFNWGTDSPSTSCGISSDGFSVRWTRTASFSSGTWRFTVTSDDGFRLYVDGSLVLDYWIDQPPTTYTVDVALTSGDHTIKLEYYENSVTAVAKLSWEKQ